MSLDGELLFDVTRLPTRGPGGAVLGTRAVTWASLSPDSSMVAFTTRGAAPMVAVWARARQIARIAATWPGGVAGPATWSPDGRWLAFEGTTAGGLVEPGAFDPAAGRVLRHPVMEGLAREGRSVWVERWVDGARLRVLVGPGRERIGGLAHVWAPAAGTFALESAIEPLAAQAPAGASLLPGGVFSADLTGDGAPETVALYRDAAGAPGALVVGPEGSAGAAGTLLPPEALGYRDWKEAERGPSLYRVATLGGRPTPILAFPAPGAPGGTLLGFFQLGADGRLTAVRMESPEGGGPALFARGRGADRALELGLIDLDGDGGAEVVTAVGRRDPLASAMTWEARVWRWEAGRLVPGPDLVPAAMREIGRLTGEAPGAEPGP